MHSAQVATSRRKSSHERWDLSQLGIDTMTTQPTPEATHTPEPWDDASKYPEIPTVRIFSKSHYIASVGNSDDSREQTEANAARIVQCVNACANISDPAKAIEQAREAVNLFVKWQTILVSRYGEELHSAEYTAALDALEMAVATQDALDQKPSE